ncbi:MAG TPA: Gfo/Idh/MocA family oxidoreductase [Opitutaceae bacterium]|nr:Gfo/Idh/MocA family oxidoreductase [Opitutaceae bacterium]
MDRVRLGIAGLGNMGTLHVNSVRAGKISRLELAAICDANLARREQFPGIPSFATADAMIASGLIDALLIATPHYSHTPLGIAGLKAGLHVLVEKPISVHKADCERLIAAHQDERQVFAAMFNQRTDPAYRRIRALVQDGGLGEIRRVNWIITNWYRTAAYYASSGWRATWEGEGGGVLLNQCPHNLDLLQWMLGLPVRVRAFCQFGRYHDIEVEDDVTAYLEFANGATGVFIASTGEAPGTSRLEITAEGGRIVYERDELRFARNAVPMSAFSRSSPQPFAQPECAETVEPVPDHGGQHNEILQNFADAVLEGRPLIAPAREGIRSVELANAMLLSAWLDQTVDLPLDGARFERLLRQRARKSPRAQRVITAAAAVDLAKSFNR